MIYKKKFEMFRLTHVTQFTQTCLNSKRLFSASIIHYAKKNRRIDPSKIQLGRRIQENKRLRRESLTIDRKDVSLEISANNPPCMLYNFEA